MSKKRIRDIVFFVLDELDAVHAAVSVHLVGDKKIRHLSREYRGKDKVTDVLSFALQSKDMPMIHIPGESVDWGDLFICVPQIERQAKQYGVTKQEEFTRMLVHGVLHLFGYDHIKPRDAKKMLPLQERIVSELS